MEIINNKKQSILLETNKFVFFRSMKNGCIIKKGLLTNDKEGQASGTSIFCKKEKSKPYLFSKKSKTFEQYSMHFPFIHCLNYNINISNDYC